MALRTPFLVLAILSACAGVLSGASDAWPLNPQGNPQVFQTRAKPLSPSL